jgi:hypothetical protein
MGWKAIGTKLCEMDLLEISLLNEESEEDNRQIELF